MADEQLAKVEQKPELEHPKPVVSGKVTIKKKSEGMKLLETFFEGDIKQVGKSVWEDILVPAVKDLLYGALDQAFRGMIYRDYSTGGRRRDRDRDSVRVRREDFTRYSRDRDRRDDRDREDVYDYGELFFEDKREADDVKEGLYDLLERYKWATVGQLYELSRLRVRQTDYNYGWRDKDARDIYVERCRGGYMLKTPRPKPLD